MSQKKSMKKIQTKNGITSEDAKIIAEQDGLYGVMSEGIYERVLRRIPDDASDLLIEEEMEKETTMEIKKALDLYIASAALQFVTFRQDRPRIAGYDRPTPSKSE